MCRGAVFYNYTLTSEQIICHHCKMIIWPSGKGMAYHFSYYLTLTRSFTASCGFFSFSLNARLFVVLSTAGFRKDAILLNFAVKAFQRSLERLILADLDFRHQYPPSRGLFFEVASYLCLYLHTSRACAEIIVESNHPVKILAVVAFVLPLFGQRRSGRQKTQ